MSTPVQLATRSIDLSQVLEIRDEQSEEIILVIGPPDAVELLVLQGADVDALRAWLQADYEDFLVQESLRNGVDMRSILEQEPPPTLDEPPF